MKELIEFIARSLVDRPEDVRVYERERGGTSRLELEVAPDDLGKVIGRQGRTARAMRTVLAVSAQKSRRRVQLDILD